MIQPLLLAAPLLPQILDVHPTNGPYLEIADAVAAAADGDVIRVADGQYQGFIVDGKSLTIVPGSDTPSVEIEGPVRLRNIGPAQQLSLGGLDIDLPYDSPDTALSMSQSSGPIRIQDCRIFPSTRASSLLAVGVDDLSLTEVDLGSLAGYYAYGRPAELRRTHAVLSGVQLHVGVDPTGWVDGDTALLVDDSIVLTLGCSIHGGHGASCDCDLSGFGTYCRCDPPCGNGGTGVRVVRGGQFESLDSSIEGGYGGPDWGFCPFGSGAADGQAIWTDSTSSALDHPGTAPTFECHPFARLGLPLNLAIDAEPTDFVMLGASPRAARSDVPGAIGVFLLDTTPGAIRRINLGTGPQTAAITIPANSSLVGATWAFQPGLVRSGGLVLGPGRTVAFLP